MGRILLKMLSCGDIVIKECISIEEVNTPSRPFESHSHVVKQTLVPLSHLTHVSFLLNLLEESRAPLEIHEVHVGTCQVDRNILS